MTTLVIVESPNKVSKISAILGDGYKVMASVGHVRDLPPKELGIEPPSFELTYQPTERGQGVLAKLKAAVAQADRVLLATDPDREGEAISWHLADALRLKNPERVTFTAITKEKILAAFAAPRPLDMQRVHAQEARRALDRIIGYRVSPALSDATGQRLGAGRVQSPAVRLVVDRERAIAAVPLASVSLECSRDGTQSVSFGDGVTRTFWLLANNVAAFPVLIAGEAAAKQLAQLAGTDGSTLRVSEAFRQVEKAPAIPQKPVSTKKEGVGQGQANNAPQRAAQGHRRPSRGGGMGID
ncbi:toprim domain-containing protein [Pseudomonas aeruginosa]|uniref:toprim domain-containing protein n=1 Tax=Pseudomonas aeruginosa TaxID=287 RepID=UPI001E33EC49|nr:toprim domain-containing protein [Pseudomonas aeruginosa]